MTIEELLIRGGITLAATFFGALSAYWLQNAREVKKEKQAKINALNNALFTLLRAVNALASFRADLKEFENDHSRPFKIRPWQPNSYDDIKLDFKELSFILSTDEPNMLHQLLIEQERFEQALKSIVLRSEYQVKVIQPLLNAANINDQLLPYEVVEASIGEVNLKGIIMATDKVYEHVYETYESSMDAVKELHAYAKRQFPNVKFISISEA